MTEKHVGVRMHLDKIRANEFKKNFKKNILQKERGIKR